MAMFLFLYFFALRWAGRNPHIGRHPAAFAVVLLSLLSVSLISCSGLSDRSGENSGSPASISLVVQGTSGTTTVKLGTLSITVP